VNIFFLKFGNAGSADNAYAQYIFGFIAVLDTTSRSSMKEWDWEGFYSTDDLGWMFRDRLLDWEGLGLKCSDACVVDHVDFWCEQGNERIRIDDLRNRVGLTPMAERHMWLLQNHVAVVRWRKRGRPF
jgi:hypothetical protein